MLPVVECTFTQVLTLLMYKFEALTSVLPFYATLYFQVTTLWKQVFYLQFIHLEVLFKMNLKYN